VDSQAIVRQSETGEQPYPGVYNQAYQENSAPDSLSLILKEAENAYVLLDPFDETEITKAHTEFLKERDCQCAAYISIGTGEDWRDDFEELKPWLSPKAWGQWEGEYFVSRLSPAVTALMKKRIDRIALLGFDWVEFDNMDWFLDEQNLRRYGLKLNREEGLAYIEELRAYAASRGLRCMAKNMRRGAEDFDGVTFESYRKQKNWWEPEDLKAFLNEGKPVIIFHYDESDGPAVLREYRAVYGPGISFLWESRKEGGYVH
jgi:endo-alpha-1,4-polygalactosaminidase (GH114 family)